MGSCRPEKDYEEVGGTAEGEGEEEDFGEVLSTILSLEIRCIPLVRAIH